MHCNITFVLANAIVMTKDEIIQTIKLQKNDKNIEGQKRFGIRGAESYGLSMPQLRIIAKGIGKNHALAQELWYTNIREARHIAVMIADKNKVTEKLMEKWLSDFDSWDIVDNCCSNLFCRTSFAYTKAHEWSTRTREYEKRTAFSLMAYLAVHDKKQQDKSFEQFLEIIIRESDDERNFVKKAVNWALRQIGKRNIRLCNKALAVCKIIQAKGDAASRWIAADAFRELNKYKQDGRIKSVGSIN